MEQTPVKILYIGNDPSVINTFENSRLFEMHHEPNGLMAIKWMTGGEFKAFGPPENLELRVEIDAIISEINLPGLNGLSLLQEIRKLHLSRGIVFILVAQFITDALRSKARSFYADGCLQKPLNADRIYDRIRYLQDHHPVLLDKKHDDFARPYKTPVAKRIFDVIVASLAIIILSPVFLLVTIVIRLESKGKVIYKSKRIGRNYEEFDFYKFRSMYEDADRRLREMGNLNQYVIQEEAVELVCSECAKLPEGELCSPAYYYDGQRICERLALIRNNSQKAFWKIPNDPRVTKVGRFLRTTNIDELPQLFNVLEGNMSIVGNRPLPVYEAHALTKSRWSRRFRSAAGMTGLWQIEFRKRKGFMSEEDRFILDNMYAQKNSFWGDLLLLLRTIPALFRKMNV
jgi:lipopolysaccharide/colanic/teichoic acid biosynthesis glycosyltransferase